MIETRKGLPLLVFSDLDGTLLDHHNYDWAAARPALDAVRDIGGGVVLATSKTAAEVAPLRAEMGLGDWPAIVENGAGILEPGAEAGESGGDYTVIREALSALPQDLRARYTGFGDLDDAGVADITGLPIGSAALARMRHFSEPGTWHGDDAGRDAFVAALAEAGISARMGGRFLTLSRGRTKADAMTDLIARFAPAHTLALGDAPNDVEMLETADLGVIIPNPDAAALPELAGEATGKIRRATKPGPFGWNLSVRQAIEDLKLSKAGDTHG